MKKVVSLLAAVSLFLSLGSAMADGLNLDGLSVEVPEISSHADIQFPDEKLSYGSTDVVEVSDDGKTLTVTTADSIEYKYTAYNSVYCYTQGFTQEMLRLDDPSSLIKSFIEDGVHLLLAKDGSLIYVADTGVSKIGKVINDANGLSESDAKQIAKLLKSEFNVDITYGTLGGNLWFVVNMQQTKGYTYFMTYVKQHEIYAQCVLADGATMNDAYSIMDKLTITAK